MTMNISERLRLALDETGISPAEMARQLDITPRAVNGWFTTGRIGKQTLARVAAATGRTVEWFLKTGDDGTLLQEPHAPYMLDSNKYALIRRYQIEAGAGNPQDSEHEEVSGLHAYRRDWLERRGLFAETCVVIDVNGESMEPTICDGDVVLINTAERKIKSGNIYAFRTSDGVQLKRLHRQLDGRVRVTSDNANKNSYPDDWLTPDNEASVIGLVVHRSGGV